MMMTSSDRSKFRVVYLAGPEVFLPNAEQIGRSKRQKCREYGFDAIFPLNADYDRAGRSLLEQAHDLFSLCVKQMDQSDLIIANMTPFRGISMDVGTAIEVGYMFSRGRPTFGYTNTPASYDQRVKDAGFDDGSSDIEPFNLFDNLMCEGPVWRTGAEVARPSGPTSLPLDDLSVFEIAVQRAAALL